MTSRKIAHLEGAGMVNFLQLAPNEKVSATLSTEDMPDAKYLFMATRSGTIKKTDLADFANVRRNGLNAIGLKERRRA